MSSSSSPADESASSSRDDGFDPYIFSVRWYEEHPEVLIEYENALKKKLKAGFTLDELEEIETKAFEFGRLVRESEMNAEKSGRWTEVHREWVKFKDNLSGGRAEAKEAYRRGYVLWRGEQETS